MEAPILHGTDESVAQRVLGNMTMEDMICFSYRRSVHWFGTPTFFMGYII